MLKTLTFHFNDRPGLLDGNKITSTMQTNKNLRLCWQIERQTDGEK